MGRGKDASGLPFVGCEGGICRQHGLAAQIDDAQARWTDQADAGARAGIAQALLACESLGTNFGEAISKHGCNFHAGAPTFLDRRDRGLGRRHDVGVVGRLRQRRQ